MRALLVSDPAKVITDLPHRIELPQGRAPLSPLHRAFKIEDLTQDKRDRLQDRKDQSREGILNHRLEIPVTFQGSEGKENLFASMLLPSVGPDARQALFESARKLPEEVIQLISLEGFKVAVVSAKEDDPLPFPVEEFDVEEYKKNVTEWVKQYKESKGVSEEEARKAREKGEEIIVAAGYPPQITPVVMESPKTLRQLAREHEARTPEQIKEFVNLTLLANPDLFIVSSFPEDLEVKRGEDLILPSFSYYKGRRIPSGADNSPFRILSGKINVDGKEEEVGGEVFTPDVVYVDGKKIETPSIAFSHAPPRLILFHGSSLSNEDGLRDWYVSHECGHALIHALKNQDPEFFNGWGGRISDLFKTRLREAESRGTSPFLTSYSATNGGEFFAEGFAAFLSGKPAVPLNPEKVTRRGEERLRLSRSVLRNRDPELYALIQEIFERVQSVAPGEAAAHRGKAA